jgi:glycosyltransferase involved in cell wall biosynthesis
MRITWVLPPVDLSGGIRVIAIYAERLRRRGHQVVAVTVQPRSPTWRDVFRSLLRRRHWPAAPGRRPSHFDKLDVELRRLPHDGPVTDRDVPDADVVIATWWETAEWVAALSPRKGAKLHFMQDYELWGGTKERVDASCRLPLPKIIIAGWVRDLLQKQFQQTPLALIRNSVEMERFHAPPRGKQPVPTVGLTYTTLMNKGPDISIKAYELARREVPGLRLVAFGSSRPTAELPLPPDTDFTFQAPDEMLKEIYARCDAWLFGTRIEGFGLPILEAMACRTPVIGTPAGAAPELLSQGGGILVPPEDPAAMADAIRKACALSDAQWRAMSDAALATATKSTWEDATDMFEEAIKKVAAHGV